MKKRMKERKKQIKKKKLSFVRRSDAWMVNDDDGGVGERVMRLYMANVFSANIEGKKKIFNAKNFHVVQSS